MNQKEKELRERIAELEKELGEAREELRAHLQGGPRVRVILRRGLKSFRYIFANGPSENSDLIMAYHSREGDQMAFSNDTNIYVSSADAEALKQHPDYPDMFCFTDN